MGVMDLCSTSAPQSQTQAYGLFPPWFAYKVPLGQQETKAGHPTLKSAHS